MDMQGCIMKPQRWNEPEQSKVISITTLKLVYTHEQNHAGGKDTDGLCLKSVQIL